MKYLLVEDMDLHILHSQYPAQGSCKEFWKWGSGIQNLLENGVLKVSKLKKKNRTRTPSFWHTPRHLMITHSSDSHQIPSENKTKSKLRSLKNCQIFKFCKKLYTRHTCWSCLIRCINIKWIQPKLLVLQSGHGMTDGRTDGWTDGRTDRRRGGNQYTPQQLRCAGIKKMGTQQLRESWILSGKLGKKGQIFALMQTLHGYWR